MTDFEVLTSILDIVQSVGLWAVFLWLYVKEKADHESTRQHYRQDLREVAGFNSNVRTLITGNKTDSIPSPQ